MSTPLGDEYLGDGVYASTDGWHLWLRTPREGGIHEIALEPEVLARLDEYRRRLNTEGTSSPASKGENP